MKEDEMIDLNQPFNTNHPYYHPVRGQVEINKNWLQRYAKRMWLIATILTVIALGFIAFGKVVGLAILAGLVLAAVILFIMSVTTYKPSTVDFMQGTVNIKGKQTIPFNAVNWAMLKAVSGQFTLHLGLNKKESFSIILNSPQYHAAEEEVDALLQLIPYTNIPDVTTEPTKGSSQIVGKNDVYVVLIRLLVAHRKDQFTS